MKKTAFLSLLLCLALAACTPVVNAPENVTNTPFSAAEQTPEAETPTLEPETVFLLPVADGFGTVFKDFDELNAYLRNETFLKPVNHYLIFNDAKGVMKLQEIRQKGSYVTVSYTLADGMYENYRFSVRLSLFETTDDGGFIPNMQRLFHGTSLKTENREVYVSGIDFEKPEGGWGKTEMIFWQEEGEDITLNTPFWIYDYYTSAEIADNIALVPIE